MAIKTIGVLFFKEFTGFFKNKTLIIITLLGLILFLGIYFIIPGDNEDQVYLAIYTESENLTLRQFLIEKEILFKSYNSLETFTEDLDNNLYPAGLIITDDLWEQFIDGSEVQIPFYISPETAEEYVDVLKAYLEIFLNELLLIIQKNTIPLTVKDITMGIDSLTEEIPLKKIFIPLIIVMIFVTELLGFGNSLMEEIESRTIVAIMVTPVKLSEFLLSKSVTGVSIIFLQSLIVLFVTGSFNNQIFYILLILLMSAIFIAGLSFLLASISHDLMTLVSWGLLMMIIIIIPVFGVLFPGLQSVWIRFIPSFLMADSLNKLLNLHKNWNDVNLTVLSIFIYSIVFYTLGLFSLKRRIECL